MIGVLLDHCCGRARLEAQEYTADDRLLARERAVKGPDKKAGQKAALTTFVTFRSQ